MKPDSLAFLNVNLPAGSLPVPILAILLMGFFAVILYALSKAKEFKDYSRDFPGQKVTVIFGLAGFTYIVVIAGSRLALGLAFPDNYSEVAWLIAGCLGFGAAAGVGKHAFSVEREEAKAKGAAAVAAATPAQPTQVLATQGSSVNVQTEAQATPERPLAAVSKPVVPQADVKPTDAIVKNALQQVSAFGGSSND